MIRKIEKPWGHEIIWAETDKYVGKVLFIKQGERLSLQYHEIKEETIYVVEGELTLIHGGEDTVLDSSTLQPGESFHVAPGTIHRFAAKNGDVTLVEVSTPELDDVVRIQDDYKRI
jgi:quercetin dioxygenase-like cupin family protein